MGVRSCADFLFLPPVFLAIGGADRTIELLTAYWDGAFSTQIFTLKQLAVERRGAGAGCRLLNAERVLDGLGVLPCGWLLHRPLELLGDGACHR